MKHATYPNPSLDSLFSLIDRGLIYPDHYSLYGASAKSNFVTGDTVRFNNTQEAFCVEIDVPGAKRDDTQVDITGHEVFITAKRSIVTSGGRKEEIMTRSFTLHKDADMEKIAAKQENGVLTIFVKRKNKDKVVTKSLKIE